MQRELTVITEALTSLWERLDHSTDDGLSAQQRLWAKQNLAVAVGNVREAIAWLNNY